VPVYKGLSVASVLEDARILFVSVTAAVAEGPRV